MINVLYQDNHVIAVNKNSGELTQPDPSGTPALEQAVAQYLKIEGNKPGDAFVGVVHRIDKPVSGVVLMAKTSKALVRLNEQLKNREFEKIYWAVVEQKPQRAQDTLVHHISRSATMNKSITHSKPTKDSKEAILQYETVAVAPNNSALLKIKLLTGRHHQIRAQLAAIGCAIEGDTKYGAKRGNKNSIALHSRSLTFLHPVKKEMMTVVAPIPENVEVWKKFKNSDK